MAGAGLAGAALMGVGDRVLAAPSPSSVGYVNQWIAEEPSSCTVWLDSSNQAYVKDTGIGSQVGQLIVNAGVVTAYGATLGAGNVQGASTTTSGLQEAINACRGTSGGGGGKVAVAGGVQYPTTSTILLYPAISLGGLGAISDFVFGTCSINPAAALNAPAIEIIVDPLNTTLVSFAAINNLTINAAGPTATLQDGIYISDANGSLLDVYIDTVGIFEVGGTGLNDQSGTKLWIDNFYSEDCKQYGVVINNTSASVRVRGSYIFGNTLAGLYATAFNYLSVSQCEIWNNTQWGLYLAPNITNTCLVSQCYLANNGGAAFNSVEIAAQNAMTYGVVLFSNNSIIENRGSGQPNLLFGLAGTTKSINLVLRGNNLFTTKAGGLAATFGFLSTLSTGYLVVKDNNGINPINKLTNPFAAAAVGLNGSAAVPTASTDYIVYGCDIWITAANSTNSNNSITIKDGAGNTVQSALSTLTALYVPIGWKINWGAFTGTAGAVTVWMP